MSSYGDDDVAHFYRWWTIFAWRQPNDIGVKLGPISVSYYRWLDGVWLWSISALNRWLIYDGLRHHA